MNHKMNLKIGLVSALMLGQSLASAAPTYFQATKYGTRLTAMDNQTPPTPLTPIRVAKGTLQIDRFETTWDASKNETNIKVTDVCKTSYDVRVFDLRNHPQNYYYTPAETTCMDNVNGSPIEIHASSSLLIADGLSKGMPTIKMHSASAYILETPSSNGAKIPYIRSQDSFTIDLNQVHFGNISAAPAGVMCMVESDPQPIGPISPAPAQPIPPPPPMPSPGITSTNSPDRCQVIYPVSYQAIWMAEDAP